MKVMCMSVMWHERYESNWHGVKKAKYSPESENGWYENDEMSNE